MLSIPLPFIISLLLLIMLARLFRQGDPSLRPAMIFVGSSAVLAIVVGLRWSVDIRAIRFLQPILAAMLPPLAWVAFTKAANVQRCVQPWLHALPVCVVMVSSATWPLWHPPIDLLLATVSFGYGTALLQRGARGQDTLTAIRIADSAKVHRATLLAGLVLIGSGFIDLLIAGDFQFFDGDHTMAIVGIGNLLLLPILAYSVAIIGTNGAPEEEDCARARSKTPASPGLPADGSIEPEPGDDKILAAMDLLMREKQMFRDPDLTLNRIARKAAIPARRISSAVNRRLGITVSQVVNAHRIERAKHCLVTTDLPVTTIMFEAGFQTKSNFNREFRRATGTSPSDYRRSNTRSHAPAISQESPVPETPLSTTRPADE